MSRSLPRRSLEVLRQSHEIEKAPARFHLDQQVDVAVRAGFASHGRAEDTDVACTAVGCASEDLLPALRQKSRSTGAGD